MKIVVIGGTGQIGSKVVGKLQAAGHEVVPASPNTGINTVTGEGLSDALTGAAVVVDVSGNRSYDEATVTEFFETSTRNLLDAGARAGVGHHVALSIVGTGRPPGNGYFRAKVAQEKLIIGSSIPYSIVHATQFFEFLVQIADTSTVDGVVRIPPVRFQPIAAEDVATAVAQTATAEPLNGHLDIAGPERGRFDGFMRRALAAQGDPREVVVDPQAPYFGTVPHEDSLVPVGDARLMEISYDAWLTR